MHKQKTTLPKFKEFEKYIKSIKKEYDFIEKCYKMGFENIADNLHSMNIAIDLLSRIFKDYDERLSKWIYEDNFGENNDVSVYDLYCRLIYEYYNNYYIENYIKHTERKWWLIAERRMFARKIIESDSFVSMNPSTQILYIHLCMYADDDGFINNTSFLIRGLGADKKDFQTLCDNGYIIPFDNGISVISHWKAHNYIQKDRYRPTIYTAEKEKLDKTKGDVYFLKE